MKWVISIVVFVVILVTTALIGAIAEKISNDSDLFMICAWLSAMVIAASFVTEVIVYL